MTTNIPIQDSPIQVDGEYISFEDFLKKYEGVRAEWVVGKVEVHGVNNSIHNEILGFLYVLFKAFFGVRSIGRVLFTGMAMYLGKDKPAREPDLIIVLNEHLNRIELNRFSGPADIAVEVVSPESVERDYGKKFVEYEEAGVREYWLFDPMRKLADVYVLTEVEEEGAKAYRYHRAKTNEQGYLISTLLPGFALDPAILWQDELPDLMKTIEIVRAMVEVES